MRTVEGSMLKSAGISPRILTKNLSVNNVHVQFNFSERHDGCSQVVERQEAAVKFLVSHQQFAKAVKPTVRDFDNPAFCFLLRVRLSSLASYPRPLT